MEKHCVGKKPMQMDANGSRKAVMVYRTDCIDSFVIALECNWLLRGLASR